MKSDPGSLTEETAMLVHSEHPRAAGTPMLMVIGGPGLGKQLVLDMSEVTVGRLSENDLVIESSSVSRRHARFVATGQGIVVRDLGSKNGVLVNGTRVEEQQIEEGDVIKLGKAVLKYTLSQATEATYYRHLVELSATDALTGLANRRHFDDVYRAQLAVASSTRRPLALILLDLDHFKQVNDRYGHPAGDHVLREVAAVVREQVRASDLAGRLGGEELGILCDGADASQAMALAERLREAVERAEFRFEGHKIRVTVSLGLAVRTGADRATAEELYKLADERLYGAKRAGRNRVGSAA